MSRFYSISQSVVPWLTVMAFPPVLNMVENTDWKIFLYVALYPMLIKYATSNPREFVSFDKLGLISLLTAIVVYFISKKSKTVKKGLDDSRNNKTAAISAYTLIVIIFTLSFYVLGYLNTNNARNSSLFI